MAPPTAAPINNPRLGKSNWGLQQQSECFFRSMQQKPHPKFDDALASFLAFSRRLLAVMKAFFGKGQ